MPPRRSLFWVSCCADMGHCPEAAERDMKFLTEEQLRELSPAETASFASPVPTQIVSSDEYMPVPQTAKQREVEARLKELSDGLAKRRGLSRRRLFPTAPGVAASFLAPNQLF